MSSLKLFFLVGCLAAPLLAAAAPPLVLPPPVPSARLGKPPRPQAARVPAALTQVPVAAPSDHRPMTDIALQPAPKAIAAAPLVPASAPLPEPQAPAASQPLAQDSSFIAREVLVGLRKACGDLWVAQLSWDIGHEAKRFEVRASTRAAVNCVVATQVDSPWVTMALGAPNTVEVFVQGNDTPRARSSKLRIVGSSTSFEVVLSQRANPAEFLPLSLD